MQQTPRTRSRTVQQRQTQQRGAIKRALEAAGRPLSPQEIHQAAQVEVPGLGIATVYRNIKGMAEEGWLQVVDLPGAPSRYEVSGKRHHHHFHCRDCDRVFEVEACPGGIKDLAPSGFELEAHELILYGLCRSCSTNA